MGIINRRRVWARGLTSIGDAHVMRPSHRNQTGDHCNGNSSDAKAECLFGCLFFFLLWLQHNPVILSILAGLTLPFIFHLPRGEIKNAPFWLKSVAGVSTFFLIFGTLSPLTIQGLSFFFKVLDNNILLRLSLWILTVGFTLAGLAFHITARRLLAGEIDSLKHRMIKKANWKEMSEQMFVKSGTCCLTALHIIRWIILT